MIDRLRRRLRSADDERLWKADLPLKPDVEDRLQSESATLSDETGVASYTPVTNGDYYTNLVRAAIAHGGAHGDHRISVPWLRMILAGLEWRRIEPETMWDGFEATGRDNRRGTNSVLPYDDLFPSETNLLRV